MRGIVAVLVVAGCLAHGNATLRLLKAKLNASPVLQKAIQYLAAPEPLPGAYARPAYAAHVSTFSVALPPVPLPSAGFGFPHQEANYAAPGVPLPSVGVGFGGPHHETYAAQAVPVPSAGFGVPQHGLQTTLIAPGVGLPAVAAGVGVPHQQTYPVQAVPLPSVAVNLAVPHHGAPGVVFAEPLALPSPHVHYHGPEAVVLGPLPGHLLEDHFNGRYAPSHVNSQLGNW